MGNTWVNKYLKKREMWLLVLGVLMLAISINHKLITAYVFRETEPGPEVKYKKYIHGKITLSGETSLNVPSVVYVDEPFRVSLYIDLGRAPEEEVIRKTENTQIRLTSSGMDCEPTDWQGIIVRNSEPPYDEVRWSFQPSSEGDFPLILSSKPLDPKFNFIRISQSEKFKVRRRFWHFMKDTWPIFSAFAGIFLTLPGIFSFVIQWRKNQHEKKDKMWQSGAPTTWSGYAGEIEIKQTSPERTRQKPITNKNRYH